jgi:hypothetical protein
MKRVTPQSIANDIVGVQPLSQATGYAFALRYSYSGIRPHKTKERIIDIQSRWDARCKRRLLDEIEKL